MGRSFDFGDKKNLGFLVWQTIIFVAVAWTAIDAPLSFVLNVPIRQHHAWWDGLISTIFICDMFYNLKQKNEENSFTPLSFDNIGKETKPYHKSVWFPVDLFASIPFDLIAYNLGIGPSLQVLRILRLARVARIGKIISVISSVPLLPKFFKMTMIMTLALVLIHWIACTWMWINPGMGSDPIEVYNKSLYWTITTLTTIGYGDITPQTNEARIFTMVIMILGVGTYGIVIGNVSRMMVQAERHKEEKKQKFQELTMYMKHYAVPLHLQKQVYSFYGHLLNKKLFDGESKIIADLPQALQNELEVFKKIKLIRNAPIFEGLPITCLKMIASKLKQEVFSPNKFIIQSGDEGKEMYILGHGEVEVIVGEKLVAKLNQGQYFGEIALLEHTTRNADVKSSSYCDLYVFDSEGFNEVVEKFPVLYERLASMYQRRKSDRKTPPPSKKAA